MDVVQYMTLNWYQQIRGGVVIKILHNQW